VPAFVRSVVVNAPVEVVFAFHEREDALARLSPPFPRVEVIRKTGGIEPGSRVDLRIGPLRWVALHTRFEKNRLFVDEQIQGPFRRWIHRHEFEDLGGRTRLTDRVEYRLRGGSVVEALFGWIVKLGLGQMFRARHLATKRFCEERSQRAG
jgi:ligand-binding SRPBCC domain-containing protein